jgi:hypothetical protein
LGVEAQATLNLRKQCGGSILKNAFRLITVLSVLSAASFAGVTVNSPANGSQSNSPLHVAATATPISSSPVRTMQVYIDGNLVYQGSGSSINSYLSFGAGNHVIAVKAWDAAGANFLKTVNVTGTGRGIFLKSPTNNATVSSSVRVQANITSSHPITATYIYDNGNLAYQQSSGTLDANIGLPGGSHYLVVQAWDSTGALFMNPVTVHSGSGSSTPPPAPAPAPASSTSSGSQVAVPSYAKQVVNIDQIGGWQSCDSCAGIGGSGPVDPYSMTQGIKSPSIDGSSATFWLGGTKPWGNALWWKQLGAQDGSSHFIYDVRFFIKDPHVSQALEFDVNQSVNGLKYIFGTECDVRTNGGWRVWDTKNARWNSTGVPCHVNGNSWNHLTWELQRVGNQTRFVAVTLNGYRRGVDKYYYAKPWNVRELNVAFQMDGDEYMDDYQVWLDKVTLYHW